jgi:hypothetical protein
MAAAYGRFAADAAARADPALTPELALAAARLALLEAGAPQSDPYVGGRAGATLRGVRSVGVV